MSDLVSVNPEKTDLPMALSNYQAAFISDIGTAESFALAIGLLFIAFIALLTLIKKSRRNVK